MILYKIDWPGKGSKLQIRYNPGYPGIVLFNAGYNFGFFFLPIMFGGGLLFTVIALITLKRAPSLT